jgi:hypothetical protein
VRDLRERGGCNGKLGLYENGYRWRCLGLSVRLGAEAWTRTTKGFVKIPTTLLEICSKSINYSFALQLPSRARHEPDPSLTSLEAFSRTPLMLILPRFQSSLPTLPAVDLSNLSAHTTLVAAVFDHSARVGWSRRFSPIHGVLIGLSPVKRNIS